MLPPPVRGAASEPSSWDDAQVSTSKPNPKIGSAPPTALPPNVSAWDSFRNVLMKARDRHAFVILIGLSTLVAGWSAFHDDAKGFRGWVLLGAIVSVLCLVADSLADAYEKKLLKESERLQLGAAEEAEKRAEIAVEAVNVFLTEAHEALFLTGPSRKDAIKALPRLMVRCASGIFEEGSRASYYELNVNAEGYRCLEDPVHSTGFGRTDEPPTPFLEERDPDHDIWALMDGPDVDNEVRSSPEVIDGLSWDRKFYDTFYSVPVKSKQIQFGFFSVNSAVKGSIGGPQRACVLAMARVLALVRLTEIPGQDRRDALPYPEVSDAGRSFESTDRKGAA